MTSAVENIALPLPGAAEARRAVSRLLKPLEAASAALIALIIVLLLGGVVSRYVFSVPVIWIDEVVSLSFLWLTMMGAALAMHRNEHLRLTLFLEMLPTPIKGFVHASALAAVAAFLLAMVGPALQYTKEEWAVNSAALNIPNSFRVAAIAFGMLAMLAILLVYALRTVARTQLVGAVVLVAAAAGACWWLSPSFADLGMLNLFIFLVGLVALCLVAGVPIAFCFGLGALTYLAFTTRMPLQVIVGRMDEGMSSFILSRRSRNQTGNTISGDSMVEMNDHDCDGAYGTICSEPSWSAVVL